MTSLNTCQVQNPGPLSPAPWKQAKVRTSAEPFCSTALIPYQNWTSILHYGFLSLLETCRLLSHVVQRLTFQINDCFFSKTFVEGEENSQKSYYSSGSSIHPPAYSGIWGWGMQTAFKPQCLFNPYGVLIFQLWSYPDYCLYCLGCEFKWMYRHSVLHLPARVPKIILLFTPTL